jgi:ribonuclease HI
MNRFWGQFNLVNDTEDGFSVSFGQPASPSAPSTRSRITRPSQISVMPSSMSRTGMEQKGILSWFSPDSADQAFTPQMQTHTTTNTPSGTSEGQADGWQRGGRQVEHRVENPTFQIPVSRLYHSLHGTSPPAQEVYLIQFDGGANPNPGPASSGAIVYTPNRRPILERGIYHNRTTNNMAEYGGLLLGLTLAKALGLRALIIEGDSQLVIRQMTGQYKVRDQGLLPNWRKAKELVKEFDYVGIRHVYREDNTEADRITKDVLIRGESYERRYIAAAQFSI